MVGLTNEQLVDFNRDGYLIIPNFHNPQPLKLRTSELIEAAPSLKSAEYANTFTTGITQTSNNHFLESADKISYFYEPTSTSIAQINKIGHALHELDPVFKQFTFEGNIKDIATSLKIKDPRVLQSMLILKQPRVGGQVSAHTDSTFLFTNPTSCVGFWFALEDCRPDNGCMYFVPRSHTRYQLSKRFVRDGKGGTETVYLDENYAENSEPSKDLIEPCEKEYVCAPVKAGSLVLIHGLVWHKSSLNASDDSRWVYTFHVIDGTSHYPNNNWLQSKRQFMKLI